MNSNYNTGLPAPIQPPNGAAMIQLHPFQPPIPPVPVPVGNPQMQQFLPAFTGFAMMDAIQQAGRNAMRSFFFNTCSRNGWQNPEFHQYVAEVAAFAEQLMVMQRQQPDQALATAARTLGAMHCALLVQRFNNELQPYIHETEAHALNQALAEYSQLAPSLQRALSPPVPAQQYGMPAGYGAPAPQYGMPAGYGAPAPQYGMPQHVGMGQHYGMPAGYGTPSMPQLRAAATASRGGGVFGQVLSNSMTPAVTETARHGRGLGPRVQRNDSGQNAELAVGPDSRPEVRVWDSREEAQRIERTHVPSRPRPFQQLGPFQAEQVGEPLPEPAGVRPAEQTQTTVADPNRPYDSIQLEGGIELRPAHQSGWQRTYTIDKPYSLVYNPNEFVLFHVNDGRGNVTERLEEKTDDMKYMDHELSAKLRGIQQERDASSGPRVDPNWDTVGKVRQAKGTAVATVPEAVDEENRKDVEFADSAKVCEQALQAHTLAEAELRVGTLPIIGPVLREGKTPVEYYVDLVTPLVTDHNVIGLVKALEQTQSFGEFFENLNEMGDKLDAEVRRHLDQRLTKVVNDVLQKNLGLSAWSVTSFFADYQELMRLMESKWGEQMAGIFEMYAPEMIGTACAVLSGPDFAEYLRTNFKDEEKQASSHMLVFRDRVSITVVPWKYTDLALEIGNGGVIPAAELPKLHRAVGQIFNRTENLPVTFAHRYIRTADKRLIEARTGYLVDGSYLLFDVK